MRLLRQLAGSFTVVVLSVSVISAQTPQENAADTARLIELLQLGRASIVADIGAGSGALTVPLARHVQPDGRVYATDVNPQRLIEIRDAVTRAELTNVTVVEGGSVQTRLPAACCDAAFMRNVYHHVGDPAVMNASLITTLRPGGRIVVVDFPPNSGVTGPAGRRDIDPAHGVTSQTVIDELRAAGFVDVRQQEWQSQGMFAVSARKP
jgi:ubiquinone/menaquinone biosynthesis C-methylase UbiE